MSPTTPRTLKLLTASTILYMVIAALAGCAAIAWDLPSEFGGSRTGLTVAQDFLYGMGSAISPPLYTILIQSVLLALTRRMDRWGIVGVLGLALIGLMTCIGALGEPINGRIFSPAAFDPLKALLMTAQILLSLAILSFGSMEWLRRGKEKYYLSHRGETLP